jgi:hypothetical protein
VQAAAVISEASEGLVDMEGQQLLKLALTQEHAAPEVDQIIVLRLS